MMKVDSSIRELLSAEGKRKFDDVAEQRVLGASTHIRLISEMMLDLGKMSVKNGSAVQDYVNNISRLCDYFRQTRGEASQAINNALNVMTNDLGHMQTADIDLAVKHLNKRIEDFHRSNQQNLDKINQYANSLLSRMDTIMLFDYSSTVDRMVDTSERSLNILIPESRVLDGGKPYLINIQKKRHHYHFIPDAAIFYYLGKCNGVFIGSETLYPDGRVFNTTGSEMLAFLCKSACVPFYVLTTLLKLDMRAKYGYQKPLVLIDLKNIYTSLSDGFETKQVDFSSPELVEIPAEFITAIITEEGIVPSTAVHQLAIGMFDKSQKD